MSLPVLQEPRELGISVGDVEGPPVYESADDVP